MGAYEGALWETKQLELQTGWQDGLYKAAKEVIYKPSSVASKLSKALSTHSMGQSIAPCSNGSSLYTSLSKKDLTVFAGTYILNLPLLRIGSNN